MGRQYLVQLNVSQCRAVHSERKPFTLYVLHVEWSDGRSWDVEHRYSEFLELHKVVAKVLGQPPNFPARRLVKSMSAEVVAERKAKLDTYMKALSEIEGIQTLQAFLDFLECTSHNIDLVRDVGVPFCVSILQDDMPCNDLEIDDEAYMVITAAGNTTVMSKVDSKLSNLRFWSKTKAQDSEDKVEGGVTVWKSEDDGTSWNSTASRTFDAAVTSMAWWTEKRTLYVGLASGQIHILTLNESSTLLEARSMIAHHIEYVYELVLDKDGKRLFSVAKDGSLAMFDVSRDDQPLLRAGIKDQQANCLELDAENQRLFVGTLTGAIIIFKIGIVLDEIHRVCDHHTQKVRRLYYHARSRHLFSACANRQSFIWNVGAPGKEYSRTRAVGALKGGPAASIRSLEYCASTKRVLTGHSNGVVCLWNTKSGQPSYALDAHQGRVMSVKWCEQDRIFWTASTDRDVKMWRLPRLLDDTETAADSNVNVSFEGADRTEIDLPIPSLQSKDSHVSSRESF